MTCHQSANRDRTMTDTDELETRARLLRTLDPLRAGEPKSRMITYGSLFAGVGGFDIGFERAGMHCLWQCEKDANCAKLLRSKWPDAMFHNDVTTFDPALFPCPDVICFGSPCQDLSVAGKRAGMAGGRSGLFYEAARIIRHYAGRGLKLAVWENVPGAFSSHGGRDFAGVLRAMAECGALDVAWRVLDAQWCGVAQRRERVFLVADFRGERAAEVLSLSACLRGDTPACVGARKDVAPTISARTSGGGGLGTDFDCDGGMIPEVMPPLSADADKGDQEPVVLQQMAVRRFTPTECERLMGWHDGHTAGFSDSTRYKMCGNGVVANVSEWLGRRIVAAIKSPLPLAPGEAKHDPALFPEDLRVQEFPQP